MLTFAYYLLKVTLCSGILYGYYLVALRNKHFHQYNRWYFLSAVALSFIIPLIKIEFWKETPHPTTAMKVITLVSEGEVYIASVNHSFWNWNNVLFAVFVFISSILLLSIIASVIKVFALIRRSPKRLLEKVCFVFSNAPGTPFSFFKYIFLKEEMDIESEAGKHILKHELAHVNEKHSGDKLLLNLVLVVAWCNPFFWLIRRELNLIHEFIADQKAVSDGDVDLFAVMLLNSAYPSQAFPLASSFFYSPIKRRLLMLTKSKRREFSYLSRIAILPLLTLVVTLFAFKLKERNKEPSSLSKSHLLTRAIDSIKTSYTRIGVIDGSERKLIFAMDRSGVIETFSKEAAMKKFNWKEADIDKFLNDETTVQADTILFHNYGKGLTRDDTSRYIHENRSDTGNARQKYLQDLQKQGEFKQQYLQDKEKYSKERQQYLEERARHEIDSKLIMQAAAGNNEPAQFTSGLDGWRNYLLRNSDLAALSEHKAPDGKYTVIIAFTVGKDGSLSNITAETKTGYGAEDIVMKAIGQGRKWQPAKRNGAFAESQVKQTLSFTRLKEKWAYVEVNSITIGNVMTTYLGN